jgi:hypothetical protein
MLRWRTFCDIKRPETRPLLKNKSLRKHYARLEKSQPGSEKSKRIPRQIVDGIG